MNIFVRTPGAHPLTKNEQKDLFLYILDGWTETELLSFGTLLGRPAAEFIKASKVCGGCLRDIIAFVDGDDNDHALVNRVPLSIFDLVLIIRRGRMTTITEAQAVFVPCSMAKP